MPPGVSDRGAYRTSLVAAGIVEDDDGAGPERRDRGVFDPGGEAFAVDRSVEETGGLDRVDTQRGAEGRRAPVAVRVASRQALAARCPAAQGVMSVLTQVWSCAGSILS